MARFIYKMQNILDLKEKMETQAKTEFALMNARLREEELKLEKINLEIVDYENDIRYINEHQLDIMKLKHLNNAIKIKKMQAREQKKRIAIAIKNVDIARGKLNQVVTERKTQEILKEKAFEEFKIELNAQESKEVDEVISFKYNMNE